MRITADTNLILRAYLGDDEAQGPAALDVLAKAEVVAVTLQSLCEFVWVLQRSYAVASADIAAAIRTLLETANVVVDRPAVEAGLKLLDAGGDFADGVIAHEGRWLGGDVFVSFDSQAVALLVSQGQAARSPG